jgi:hypothetical protein
MHHYRRTLADAVEHDRSLCLSQHLAHDVNALGFEPFEVGQGLGYLSPSIHTAIMAGKICITMSKNEAWSNRREAATAQGRTSLHRTKSGFPKWVGFFVRAAVLRMAKTLSSNGASFGI